MLNWFPRLQRFSPLHISQACLSSESCWNILKHILSFLHSFFWQHPARGSVCWEMLYLFSSFPSLLRIREAWPAGFVHLSSPPPHLQVFNCSRPITSVDIQRTRCLGLLSNISSDSMGKESINSLEVTERKGVTVGRTSFLSVCRYSYKNHISSICVRMLKCIKKMRCILPRNHWAQSATCFLLSSGNMGVCGSWHTCGIYSLNNKCL